MVKVVMSISALLMCSFAGAATPLEDQFARIYEALPRAHQLVKDFDAELDQKSEGDLFLNPTYLKFLALRNSVERTEADVVQTYEQAWDLHQPDVLDSFHALVEKATPEQRYALARVGEALQQWQPPAGAQRDQRFAAFKRMKSQIAFDDVAAAYEAVLPEIEQQSLELNGASALAQEIAIGELYGQISERNTFKNITGKNFVANRWALTFDDGPHASISAKVRKVLSDYGLKATFFELSNNVAAHPGVSKAIHQDGHEIASHSIDHKDLTKLNAKAIKNEVSGSRDAIEATMAEQGVSISIRYFRCPYGAGVFPPQSQKVLDAIAESGMTHVLWNVDSLDWQDKNSTSVRDRVIKQMKGQKHGIILFHDIQAATPTSLKYVLDSDYVHDNGISFTGL
jgi:peptidoglycan/xylan/chitin deacetylase (PgdA/CDA1 family)